MIKVTHKNRIKMEVTIKINLIRQVLHKHINMKKLYCGGSGTHMLNHCEIKDAIEIDH